MVPTTTTTTTITLLLILMTAPRARIASVLIDLTTPCFRKLASSSSSSMKLQSPKIDHTLSSDSRISISRRTNSNNNKCHRANCQYRHNRNPDTLVSNLLPRILLIINTIMVWAPCQKVTKGSMPQSPQWRIFLH